MKKIIIISTLSSLLLMGSAMAATVFTGGKGDCTQKAHGTTNTWTCPGPMIVFHSSGDSCDQSGTNTKLSCVGITYTNNFICMSGWKQNYGGVAGLNYCPQ